MNGPTLEDYEKIVCVADAMYAALRNLPCRCLHNIPYESDKVKRELKRECGRCKAMREYEALRPAQVAA